METLENILYSDCHDVMEANFIWQIYLIFHIFSNIQHDYYYKKYLNILLTRTTILIKLLLQLNFLLIDRNFLFHAQTPQLNRSTTTSFLHCIRIIIRYYTLTKHSFFHGHTCIYIIVNKLTSRSKNDNQSSINNLTLIYNS